MLVALQEGVQADDRARANPGMLKASTSRLVYCVGLFALTACAVLPAPVVETSMAVVTSAPLSAEERLASSIRDRIELEATLPAGHADLATAAATESALRSLAFAENPTAARTDLIAALADELSSALAERTRIASDDSADTASGARMEKVISGLIGAINAEVHRTQV